MVAIIIFSFPESIILLIIPVMIMHFKYSILFLYFEILSSAIAIFRFIVQYYYRINHAISKTSFKIILISSNLISVTITILVHQTLRETPSYYYNHSYFTD